uniref:Dynein heavy chain-like protein PF11_0240 n=1 Tax=Piliocolobus tephrosceles TaxID=591936 RepID=A0A8C9H051_9PRIM
MGQGQESIATKYLNDLSQSGGYVFLQNIHLMTKWLKEFEEILDNILANAHPTFRLFLSSAVPTEKNSTILPEKLLKKCIRINNEKSYSLKENIKVCLDKFMNINVDAVGDVTENGTGNASINGTAPVSKYDQDDKLKTVIFGISYYHSLLLARFLYGKIGFCQSYSFNDNDLEISFNIIKRYLIHSNIFPLADVLFLVGEIIYGGHITDVWDRRINKTYIKYILNEVYKHITMINDRNNIQVDDGRETNKPNQGICIENGTITNTTENDSNTFETVQNNQNDRNNNNISGILKNTQTNIFFEAFKFPDCTKYNLAQLKKYVDEKLKKEQTYLLGLHINAEIEYMKNECSRILQNLQELGSREIITSASDGSENINESNNISNKNDKQKSSNTSTNALYSLINQLLNELPEKIIIEDIKFEEITMNTFVVIALKETEQFNILLKCINDTLIEIKLVLDGILNINDKIQNTINSLLLHNIPEIWKNYSYPSKKKLMPWYNNLKLRINFMNEWINIIKNNVSIPNSVWLSALFNPIAFLTAIKQTFSHHAHIPIDKLKLKWYVTNVTKLEDLNNKNNSIYIHGLYLQGASWFINAKNDTLGFDTQNINDNTSYGNLVEAIPKHTYSPMPIIYVCCITNEQDEQMQQNGNINYLNTPLYVTSDRGNTYVCSIDLNLETDDIQDKWILAGVALFLSND